MDIITTLCLLWSAIYCIVKLITIFSNKGEEKIHWSKTLRTTFQDGTSSDVRTTEEKEEIKEVHEMKYGEIKIIFKDGSEKSYKTMLEDDEGETWYNTEYLDFDFDGFVKILSIEDLDRTRSYIARDLIREIIVDKEV
jgi:hypothetical protein